MRLRCLLVHSTMIQTESVKSAWCRAIWARSPIPRCQTRICLVRSWGARGEPDDDEAVGINGDLGPTAKVLI